VSDFCIEEKNPVPCKGWQDWNSEYEVKKLRGIADVLVWGVERRELMRLCKGTEC